MSSYKDLLERVGEEAWRRTKRAYPDTNCKEAKEYMDQICYTILRQYLCLTR